MSLIVYMNLYFSIMLDDNEHKMAKMIEDEWSTIFDTVETYEYRVMVSKPDLDSVLFSNKCWVVDLAGLIAISNTN